MSDTDPAAAHVLVLDGDSQASLDVIASLGARGLDVTVGADAPNSLGATSCHVDGEFVYPDPGSHPAAFIDELAAFLDRTDYYAVFPVRDDTTTVVARDKPRLEATGTRVGVEDWERFERVADKARTFEFVDSLSVPTPDTRAPETLADVEAFADSLSYPVVVKSRSKHVADADGRLHTHEVEDSDYADSPQDLVETYERLLYADSGTQNEPPIVQEYVDGDTTTTVGVADDGELVAHFQELRLRTTPASGGNSTLIRGFRNEKMLAYAREIVTELGWTGPIQVEFMRTPDGEFYLVEVNGRYWGSLPLAVDSGVDVPWFHLAVLAGIPVEAPTAYRDDVVHQRLLYGDLKWLAEQLGDGNVAALGPFVAALIRHEQVFVRLDDPWTTVAALRQAATLCANEVRDTVVQFVRRFAPRKPSLSRHQ